MERHKVNRDLTKYYIQKVEKIVEIIQQSSATYLKMTIQRPKLKNGKLKI